MTINLSFATASSLALIIGVSALSETAASERIVCRSLHAHQSAVFLPPEECDSPIGLCTEGRIHSGPLRGKTFFTALELVPDAGLVAPPFAVVSYSGELEIVTRHGTIMAHDVGVFDPRPPPEGDGSFAQFDRIVDGTGRFKDAFGTIFLAGTGNEDGTGFESQLSGELCIRINRRNER